MKRIEIVEVGPRDGLQNEKAILEVADKLAQAPLYIDDSSDIGIMEIRAKARAED